MLASALAGALLFGWLTQRMGLSPIVGYLLAGILVGPHTPGFVANATLASQLAEIGVILLMFGVGIHFRPQELLRVWRLALPGAVGQSLTTALLGWCIALFFGWGIVAGFILGMGLAVASTVVLIRMLNEQGRLSTVEGHVAVGWLIVEDIFTVLILVILPAFQPDSSYSVTTSLLLALLKVGLFALLILWLGPRLISPILERLAKARSVELFTLSIFVLALSVAAIAATVFQVSIALGAFMGGLVVAQSRVGEQAAADILPFKDVFSALFFVSVGMLFDIQFVINNPYMTLAALAVVLIAKPLVAVIIVVLLKGSIATALTVSIGLAQIGEFSFILASLSRQLELLPQEGYDVLVACALISIAVNPLFFRLVPYLEKLWNKRDISKRRNKKKKRSQKNAEEYSESSVALIVGYGKIGEYIARRLKFDFDIIVIVDNRLEIVDKASHSGFKAFYGNAQSDTILVAAGISLARYVIITSSNVPSKIMICQACRRLNDQIEIICLSNSEDERLYLEEAGANSVVELPDLILEAVQKRITVR